MLLLLVLVCVPRSISDATLHENDIGDVFTDFFNGLLEIIEYGIYEARIKTGIEDPDAPKGEISTLTDIELSKQTDRVPALLGTRFGLRYVVKGSPEGEEITVTVKYSYPELTDPKSKKSFAGNEFVRRLRIGIPYYNDYAFEEDWELVPGTWDIQIYFKNKKLGGKTFEIYRPKDK